MMRSVILSEWRWDYDAVLYTRVSKYSGARGHGVVGGECKRKKKTYLRPSDPV